MRASAASSATAEAYAAKVSTHARTTIEQSLYSGREFEDLAQRLSQAQEGAGGEDRSSEDEATVALLYELNGAGPPEATPLTETNCEGKIGNVPCHARMIFLLGYPSAQFLNALGARV